MTELLNGTYTLIGPRGHRTVNIKTCRGGALKDRRIAELLTGPDNTADYQGFGFVNADGTIATWSRHRDTQFEIIARVFNKVILGSGIAGYTFDVEKRCIRCNRKLTHPESLRTGIGPECAGR